jgi:hypothetical protein
MQHVMRDGAAQGRTLFVPGSRFGEYHIRRLPGQGGMGSVYEAEQADGRVVALKVLITHVRQGEALYRNYSAFRREQRMRGVCRNGCAATLLLSPSHHIIQRMRRRP